MTDTQNRISTGSAQADEILKGGFPSNSINIIMGQPGTGKTIFVEQMAFHNADDERPILYLATLSEPVSKVIKYLQRFDFFDENKVGSAVQYQDIGSDLSKDGINALIPLLKEAIKRSSPKIIIIDSFKALHDLAESIADMRRMLFELTGLLTAYDTTVFLLGEYTDENARVLPEFAIVDGIIQFMRSAQSARDERFLRVLKLRGSGYLEGLHGFSITAKGLDIYPRLVTPEVPKDYVSVQERTPSGIDGLDKIIGGGLWKGSSTLLVGATGTGKTTLALQFAIEGTRQGVRSLYVNFQENPNQMARSIRNLSDRDVQQTLESGLDLLYVSPVEVQIDSVIVTLFRMIQEKGAGRVVIDSIGDLAMCASDPQRLHDYLYALVQQFAVKGITAMFTLEIGARSSSGAESALGRVSYMSDNVLWLSLSHAKIHREITCTKARGSEQSLANHEFYIAKDGLHISDRPQS
jgi:circadian clock protein KaiC